MKKSILFYVLILLTFVVNAQYYQTGQDPESIEWKKIDTRHFRLIFPDYYEEQAIKLAGNLDIAYPYVSFTLKHNPAKIPFVLHTQTVQSNGLVAWAPRRAEFFTTPHQAIYPQDWLEQLALHEFRHVVQVDKVHSNLPKWAKFLLGEQSSALAFGAHLPWWFIEGDAVVTETALSRYGRGRLPSFLMEHQAYVVEKGVLPYDKAEFRSFVDYVPNHYKLGYYLAGNLRARHGSILWEEVLTKAGSKPLSLFPMKRVLRERTGMNIVGNYYSVFDSLQAVWQKEDIQYKSVTYQVLSGESRFFTNYNYNHWLNDSLIVSYKTANDEIPSFVKIDLNDNKEFKLFLPGRVFSESVSYRNEWVAWSEQISNVRWQHSGYSLLHIRNLDTKREFVISPKYKSLSPSMSPDKTKLVVVETNYSNEHYLSVYQIPGGKLLQRFQTPDNNYFFSPEWLNNEEVAAIILTQNGKRLVRIHFDRDSMDMLLDYDLGDIKHLRFGGNYLYFIGSYTGKNCLFRLNPESDSVELVYEPRFGAESPAISDNGEKILLSDYTADGFRLIEISAKNDKVKNYKELTPHRYELAEKLASQESGIPVFANSAGNETYTSEKYSKGSNLFKFHSWAPAYIDPVAYEFSPGVSLMSQNALGTSETILGYKWDLTENTGRIMATYSYKGLFPVLDFNISHGNRASHYNLVRQVPASRGIVRQDTIRQRFTWAESRAGVAIKLPLIFDRGHFNRLIQPQIQYEYNYFNHNESTPHNFNEGNFQSLTYRMYLSQMLRSSYMDMYPDFGIILDGIYRHSPFGMIRAGDLKAIQSLLYFPGIMKNHGIRLYAGTQQKDNSGTMEFGDAVRYARGWGKISTTAVSTGGIDYKMPLFYPEWSFWGFLYVRRISMSLFADYSQLKGNFYSNGNIAGTFTENISSLGTEITANANIIRFYAPSVIGFRASYLPEMKNVYFNMLFSIDFTSF